MIRPHPFTTASLIGALVAAGLLALTGAGATLEQAALDWRYRITPPPTRSSPVIMVVLSGSQVRPPGREVRDDLADFLDTLRAMPLEDRPDAVVIDIALTRLPRSVPRGIPPWKRIVEATRDLGNVVHAGIFTYRQDDIRDTPRDVRSLVPHSLPPTPGLPVARVARGVRLPPDPILDELYGAAGGVGFITLEPGSADPGGTSLHTFPMLTRYRSDLASDQVGERTYLSLALAGVAQVLCGTTPLDQCVRATQNGIELRGVDARSIPLDEQGRFWVNYRKRFRMLTHGVAGVSPSIGRTGYPEVVLFVPPAEADGARTYPLPGSERGGRFSHLDGRGLDPGNLFARRVLLVVDGQERSAVLSPLGGDYLQSSVHAQVMANILEEDYLRRVPAVPVTALLLVLLTVSLVWRGRSRVSTDVAPAPATSSPVRQALLLAPEALFVVLWIAFALAVFARTRTVVPVVYPCAVLLGSFFGWRFVLPRHLRREVQRQKALLEARDRQTETLAHEIRALEAARDDAVRRMSEALRQTRDQDALLPDSDPTWEASVRELEELDQLLESARETLAGKAGSIRAFSKTTSSPSPAQSALLEKLGDGKAQVQAAQARLEAVRAELTALEPSVARYQTWYRTWAPVYQGVVKQLRSILDVAVDHLAALEPQPADPEPVEDATPLTPDLELVEKTRCLTGDPRLTRILRDVVDVYAPLDTPVLVLGETGTGKELIARAIHANSPRSGNRPSPVFQNCANLDANLATSRLFGHRKGAFSGAHANRDGVFVEADGGTLVLDELGELPLEVQGMLLRVLEDGVVTPLGGGERDARRVDVRVVGSTNVDLEEAIAEGRFRADLYHRLRRLPPIVLPPLRDRVGDVLLLTDHFWTEACKSYGKTCELSPDARRFLATSHHWPGNVRELQNVISGLVAMSRDPVVSIDEVKRQVGPGRLSDTSDTHVMFTNAELDLLRIQRREKFNMRACGNAQDYPGNRATADRHFRVLLAKALSACAWDIEAAAQAVAGDDPALVRQVTTRARRFVGNLQKRLLAAGDTDEARSALKKSIKREYSPHHEHILKLLDAIANGWLPA